MKSLQLKIISIERTIFSGEVKEVTLPGERALFTILPMHAPIISTLTEGVISFIPIARIEEQDYENGLEPDGETVRFKVSGGFLEMNEDVVTVCITE